MAKCSACNRPSTSQASFQNAQDGGANGTYSIAVAGAGTAALPISFALAATLDTGYVPTIAGLTVGTGGALTTRVERVGKEVTFTFSLTLGTGFVLPLTLVVPLPASLPMRSAVRAGRIIGQAGIVDVSPANQYQGLIAGNGDATNLVVGAMGTNGVRVNLTGGTPITFAAGDIIEFMFKYTTA